MLPDEPSRPDGNSSDAAIMGARLLRARSWIAGLALLLGAIIAGRLVIGHPTSGPIYTSLTLHTMPWSATLDEGTGLLFVVNRPLGGSDPPPAYTFASAGSYSFAANGNHSNIYELRPIHSPDTISMLNAEGRAMVRTVPVGANPGSAAVDPGHGLLYVTSEDEDTLSVRDERTAALLHTMSVGTRPSALAVSAGTGRLFVVNGGDGTVSVADMGNNQVLRTIIVPAAVDGANAAVDARIGRVFVAGSGSLSILDARTGALLKTEALEPQGVPGPASPAQTGSVARTGMAVDEHAGRVYVLAAGLLTIVDASSGSVLRSIAVGSDATALALDARDGHLFLTRRAMVDSSGAIEGTGSLEVLDPLTGAALRTVSLGIAPIAVAVDERAGRVVVVDSGGDRRESDPLGWLPSGLRQRLPFAPTRRAGASREPARVLVLRLADLEK